MLFSFPTNNVPFSLTIGVTTKKPERIRVQIYDPKKPNTYYINHPTVVKGYRELELPMPASPSQCTVKVYNDSYGNFDNDEDQSFSVDKFKANALHKHPITWMTEQDRSAAKFFKEFCQNAAVLSATVKATGKPSIYTSDDGKFTIHYYDYLTDGKGRKVNTPARIGHARGIIEISKMDYLKFTVSERYMIILHEYSHKYKNPEVNRPIGDEVSADLQGACIYLGEGWSPVEALRAFLKVFNGARTPSNKKRYLIIRDFIRKFLSNDLHKYVTFANVPIRKS